MSTRLQVLLDEAELDEIRRLARTQHLTVAEWVRQALRHAARRAPRGEARQKLEAIRTASRHDFPIGDPAQLLAEIERGYAAEPPG